MLHVDKALLWCVYTLVGGGGGCRSITSRGLSAFVTADFSTNVLIARKERFEFQLQKKAPFLKAFVSALGISTPCLLLAEIVLS